MPNFYKRLNYTFGNEDWKTERQALRLKPNDRVICITGSGDRPLHILLDECQEVVAIDANRAQNHLLKLKSAALKHLSYDEYIAFLEGTKEVDKTSFLAKIFENMDEDSRQFWQKNKKKVEKGILYQGSLESLLRMFSYAFRFFRGKKIQSLFEFDKLEDQQIFIQKKWNVFFWRKAFDLALHPWIARFLINDLGTYKNTDRSIPGGAYFYNRMNACLSHTLAKDNYFISLFLRGTVDKEAYPPYLTQQGSQVIKSQLDRLTIKTDDLITYLEKASNNSFDAFSISDVASYLPAHDFNRLISAIYRTARPGARFSIRQFLSSHVIPSGLTQNFQRNNFLEKKLEEEDHCFLYRYMVGEIAK